MKITGELLGIEYLYDQTSKPLCTVNLDTEVESDNDDEEDSAIDDDDDDYMVDMTIPVDAIFTHGTHGKLKVNTFILFLLFILF